MLNWIFIVLSHQNNIQQTDMLLHLNTWSWQQVFALTPYGLMLISSTDRLHLNTWSWQQVFALTPYGLMLISSTDRHVAPLEHMILTTSLCSYSLWPHAHQLNRQTCCSTWTHYLDNILLMASCSSAQQTDMLLHLNTLSWQQVFALTPYGNAHQLNRQTCCYTWTHYLDNKSLLLLLMASCSSAQQTNMLLHLNTLSWQQVFALTPYGLMLISSTDRHVAPLEHIILTTSLCSYSLWPHAHQLNRQTCCSTWTHYLDNKSLLLLLMASCSSAQQTDMLLHLNTLSWQQVFALTLMASCSSAQQTDMLLHLNTLSWQQVFALTPYGLMLISSTDRHVAPLEHIILTTSLCSYSLWPHAHQLNRQTCCSTWTHYLDNKSLLLLLMASCSSAQQTDMLLHLNTLSWQQVFALTPYGLMLISSTDRHVATLEHIILTTSLCSYSLWPHAHQLNRQTCCSTWTHDLDNKSLLLLLMASCSSAQQTDMLLHLNTLSWQQVFALTPYGLMLISSTDRHVAPLEHIILTTSLCSYSLWPHAHQLNRQTCCSTWTHDLDNKSLLLLLMASCSSAQQTDMLLHLNTLSWQQVFALTPYGLMLISSTDRHVAPLEHIILTTSLCSYSLWPHAHQLNRQTCCSTWTHDLDNKSLLLLLMASCSSAQQTDMLLHLNTLSWQQVFALTPYGLMLISSTDRHVAPLEHIILTTSLCSYSLWPHAHQLNRQTCCSTWTHDLDNKSLLLLLMASCSSAQQTDMLLHLNTLSWQQVFALTPYGLMLISSTDRHVAPLEHIILTTSLCSYSLWPHAHQLNRQTCCYTWTHYLDNKSLLLLLMASCSSAQQTDMLLHLNTLSWQQVFALTPYGLMLISSTDRHVAPLEHIILTTSLCSYSLWPHAHQLNRQTPLEHIVLTTSLCSYSLWPHAHQLNRQTCCYTWTHYLDNKSLLLLLMASCSSAQQTDMLLHLNTLSWQQVFALTPYGLMLISSTDRHVATLEHIILTTSLCSYSLWPHAHQLNRQTCCSTWTHYLDNKSLLLLLMASCSSAQQTDMLLHLNTLSWQQVFALTPYGLMLISSTDRHVATLEHIILTTSLCSYSLWPHAHQLNRQTCCSTWTHYLDNKSLLLLPSCSSAQQTDMLLHLNTLSWQQVFALTPYGLMLISSTDRHVAPLEHIILTTSLCSYSLWPHAHQLNRQTCCSTWTHYLDNKSLLLLLMASCSSAQQTDMLLHLNTLSWQQVFALTPYGLMLISSTDRHVAPLEHIILTTSLCSYSLWPHAHQLNRQTCCSTWTHCLDNKSLLLLFMASCSSAQQTDMLLHLNTISWQPDFVLTLYSCMVSMEAPNTNFIVFNLTWPDI